MGISMAARREVLRVVRERYVGRSRSEKSRILDEFVAVTGYHRKHALRLLNQDGKMPDRPQRVGRRIYDEAVRAALVIVWETADRICGKRLKAVLPSLVESMERHGHLSLDEEVRRRLLAASAVTIDRLLAPIREEAGRRKRRCLPPSPRDAGALANSAAHQIFVVVAFRWRSSSGFPGGPFDHIRGAYRGDD